MINIHEANRSVLFNGYFCCGNINFKTHRGQKQHLPYTYFSLVSKKEHSSLSIGWWNILCLSINRDWRFTSATVRNSLQHKVSKSEIVWDPQGMRCPLSAQSIGNLNIHNPTGHTIINNHHYSNPKLCIYLSQHVRASDSTKSFSVKMNQMVLTQFFPIEWHSSEQRSASIYTFQCGRIIFIIYERN